MNSTSEPLRVLHVIDSLVAGGKERQLLELLKGLQGDGHVICELAVLSDQVEYDALWSLDAKVHFLTRKYRYDLAIFTRLSAIVRQFRPHILHSWNSMCSIYVAPIARFAGAKFVNGFVRDAPPNLTLRHADYFRGQLTMPLSDAIIANSKAGLRAYNVPPRKGVCIYNGFDPQRILNLVRPEEVKTSLGIHTEYVVGMVAAFSERKDYNTFLRTAQAVLEVRQDVTFVAVGGGNQLSEIRNKYPEEQFPGVRFLGMRQDVENIVQIFTVGVLVSNADVHGEGTSNTIAEYMMLGKPVIATDAGGNDELVQEKMTGFLIGNHDSRALAGHILRLLDDPFLAARLGENGKRRIANFFSLAQMAQSYVRLYRDLAK